MLAKLENFEDNPVRKNRFLDHLLARFAENFNDYALLMHSLFGERGSEEILEDKVHFIREYGEVFRSKSLYVLQTGLGNRECRGHHPPTRPADRYSRQQLPDIRSLFGDRNDRFAFSR